MTREDIYESYKTFLLSLIPAQEWENAVLNVKIQPGSLGMNGAAFLKDGTKASLRTKFSPELKEQTLLLHDLTTENGKNKWNKLKYTLFPSLQYQVEFIWDEVWQNEVDSLNKEAKQSDPSYNLPKWKWES